MKREEQQERQKRAIKLYLSGKPMDNICQETGYTSAMVYWLMKKYNVIPDRTMQRSPYPGKLMRTAGIARNTAKRVLLYARAMDEMPHLELDKAKLHITPDMEQQVNKILGSVGCSLMLLPFPVIYNVKHNKYFKLNWEQYVELHAAPAYYLQANANTIKSGWRDKEK